MEKFEDIVSIKQAAELLGYHPDYVSSLIRTGRLTGKKVGRNWFTTKEAIDLYTSKNRFAPVANFLFRVLNRKTFVYISLALIIFLLGFIYNNPAPTQLQVDKPHGRDNIEIDDGLFFKE